MELTGPDFTYLPDQTALVLTELGRQLFMEEFTLVGGTALSLQLFHRLSEDLDFLFEGETLPAKKIKRNIHILFKKYRIIRENDQDQIDFLIQGVKVTFFTSESILVDFPIKTDSFRFQHLYIANPLTIAVLKLSAIAQRNTLRDYYDLYFLSKYVFPLDKIIETTKQLVPNLSPVTYTETLVFTDDIPETNMAEHLQPKEMISKQEIADYFIQEIRKIKEKI